MSNSKINYDGRTFIAKENSENGEVGEATEFSYHQEDSVFWAEYSGGEVVRGHLIGTAADNGTLDFHYQHLNEDGEIRIGKCHSVPRKTDNGRLVMDENWQWLNGDKSTGTSVVIEK
ncbi:n-acetylglutamate synthase [Corticicoccus populi]|uniref:N-acetylglutamate synthase n=1 Tax=Corticicoccus populi TaxID=1812821 RepID=A0ABW5WW98_9STAP